MSSKRKWELTQRVLICWSPDHRRIYSKLRKSVSWKHEIWHNGYGWKDSHNHVGPTPKYGQSQPSILSSTVYLLWNFDWLLYSQRSIPQYYSQPATTIEQSNSSLRYTIPISFMVKIRGTWIHFNINKISYQSV